MHVSETQMYTESSADHNKSLLHGKNCAFVHGCHRFHRTQEIHPILEIQEIYLFIHIKSEFFHKSSHKIGLLP